MKTQNFGILVQLSIIALLIFALLQALAGLFLGI